MALRAEWLSLDEAIERAGLDASRMFRALSELETTGLARREPGGLVRGLA